MARTRRVSKEASEPATDTSSLRREIYVVGAVRRVVRVRRAPRNGVVSGH